MSKELPLMEPTGEMLEDRSSRGKRRPWKERKSQSLSLSGSYRRIGEKDKSERVAGCGHRLHFHECPKGHERRLISARFCKVRLCPMCAWRRSLKVAHQVRLVAHEAVAGLPDLRFLLLTLTERNCDPGQLVEVLDGMNAAWHRLTNRAEWRKSVVGWFRSLEVTRNAETGQYHPHYHVVVAVRQSYFKKGYIGHGRWVELWREARQLDYDPWVHVKRIRQREQDRQEVDQAAAEVAKYASDPDSYLTDDQKSTDEAVRLLDAALAGRRLLAYGGLLKDVWQALNAAGKVDDAEDGNLVHVDDEAVGACRCSVCNSDMLEHVYRWHVGLKNYVG